MDKEPPQKRKKSLTPSKSRISSPKNKQPVKGSSRTLNYSSVPFTSKSLEFLIDRARKTAITTRQGQAEHNDESNSPSQLPSPPHELREASSSQSSVEVGNSSLLDWALPSTSFAAQNLEVNRKVQAREEHPSVDETFQHANSSRQPPNKDKAPKSLNSDGPSEDESLETPELSQQILDKKLELAALEVLKGQEKVLSLLGDNLNNMRKLIDSNINSGDDVLSRTILHHSMHLSALIRWMTSAGFILPHDYKSYLAFCEAEYSYPPNEIREPAKDDNAGLEAVTQKLFDLFEKKLKEGLEGIHVRPQEHMTEQIQEDRQVQPNVDEENRDTTMSFHENLSTLPPSPVPQNGPKHTPLEANVIWCCSTSKFKLGEAINTAPFIDFMVENEGKVEMKSNYRWLVSFTSQDEAMKVFLTLKDKYITWLKSPTMKPYFGLPSFGGSKLFHIRIADILLDDLRRWWLIEDSRDPLFKKELAINLIQRNPNLFAVEDIFDIQTREVRFESGELQERHKDQSTEKRIAFTLKVGPLSFDNCKPIMGKQKSGINFWLSPANYEAKLERLKKESFTLGGKNKKYPDKNDVTPPPNQQMRIWGNFYPLICERCFREGHSTNSCKFSKRAAPNISPCTFCMNKGRQKVDHGSLSFQCPRYKELSKLLEENTADYLGGY